VRRVAALLGILCLVLPGLTACGSDDAGSGASGSVEVSGEFGQEPKVTYDGQLVRETTDVEVLSEGDGAVVEEGTPAFVHLYIGNGFSGEKASSSYDSKQPLLITPGGDTVKGISKAIAGHKVGSRVQVLAAPEDAWAEVGNPDLFIGNGDSVVFVVDILSGVLTGPQGAEQSVPKGLPAPEVANGKVSAFDFSTVGAAPPKELRVVTLVEGDGPAIKKGSWLAMRYLGQVWKGKEPFDENYSAEQITPFQIGVGGLIPAWDEGLVGVTQGSRVLLAVPPKDGYGKAGNQQADIKGTDTLVFVVDVLGVS
jgi:peptidylprolyl isomerase